MLVQVVRPVAVGFVPGEAVLAGDDGEGEVGIDPRHHVDALDSGAGRNTKGGSLVYLVAKDLRMSHDIIVGWGRRVIRSLRESRSPDNADSNQRRVHVVIGNRDAVNAILRFLPSCYDIDSRVLDCGWKGVVWGSGKQ